MAYFIIFVVCTSCLIQFISAATLPLKFVTSPEHPVSFVDDTPVENSPRQPHDITVTSRPHNVLDKIQGTDLDVDGLGEETLGAWKQWLSTSQNRSTLKTNTNEKTFTQQQIMEKLFNDYHKHLQEQKNKNNKNPTANNSPWPLDTEHDDGSLRPSDAMTNLKFETLHSFNQPPKDGWVSMQPVPWSVSKISKWTPNKHSSSHHQSSSVYGGTKPFDRPQNGERPYGGGSSWNNDRPQISQWGNDKPQTAPWSSDRPQPPSFGAGNKPPSFGSGNRPSYGSNDRPQSPSFGSNDRPQSPSHGSNDRPQSPSYGFNDRPQSPSYGSSSKPQNWGGSDSSSWHEPANKPGWANVPVDSEPESNKPLTWNTVPKPQWGSVSASKPESVTIKPWIDNKPEWTDLNFRPVSNKPSYGGSSRPPQTTQVVNHHIGIITDSKPADWPSDPPFTSSQHKPSSLYPGTNRPHKGDRPKPHYPPNSELAYNEDEKTASIVTASQQKPEASSDAGKWVLLSSTRGYTVPPSNRGNRAFRFSASPNNMASVSTNLGIRLTVLPAQNNKSVISHGGLLEVDKSFETVEAAAAQAHLDSAASAAMVVKVPNPKPVKNKGKHPQKQQHINSTNTLGAPQFVSPTVKVYTTGPSTPVEVENRKKALIAAIGAGMLPATMAALVPMFLGRRRRDTESLTDMLEEAQRRLDVLHRLPRSTFNVKRPRRRREES